MDKPLTLFQRLTRNVRWFFEDIVTGVTGRGTLHYVYGERVHSDGESHRPRLDVNPATGFPMVDDCVDALGSPFGTKLRD